MTDSRTTWRIQTSTLRRLALFLSMLMSGGILLIPRVPVLVLVLVLVLLLVLVLVLVSASCVLDGLIFQIASLWRGASCVDVCASLQKMAATMSWRGSNHAVPDIWFAQDCYLAIERYRCTDSIIK